MRVCYTFQSAEEIDPGYLEGQTILSQILLSGSVFGLLTTIILMIPGQQSTRLYMMYTSSFIDDENYIKVYQLLSFEDKFIDE